MVISPKRFVEWNYRGTHFKSMYYDVSRWSRED